MSFFVLLSERHVNKTLKVNYFKNERLSFMFTLMKIMNVFSRILHYFRTIQIPNLNIWIKFQRIKLPLMYFVNQFAHYLIEKFLYWKICQTCMSLLSYKVIRKCEFIVYIYNKFYDVMDLMFRRITEDNQENHTFFIFLF